MRVTSTGASVYLTAGGRATIIFDARPSQQQTGAPSLSLRDLVGDDGAAARIAMVITANFHAHLCTRVSV
jgi:hypothetical protein